MRLIVHRVRTSPAEAQLLGKSAPGEVVSVEAGLAVATGDGLLFLEEVQPAGKRVMQVADFLRGNPVQVGDRLE